MKTILTSTLLLFTLLMTNCSTMKNTSENKLQAKAPFTVTEAVYTINKGKPYNTISIRKTNPEIELNEIFFLGRKLKLAKENSIYTAKITNTEFKDMVLHADTKKEYGNTPPTVEKIPFDLKNNEAIVSYTINNNTNFYKVKVTSR